MIEYDDGKLEVVGYADGVALVIEDSGLVKRLILSMDHAAVRKLIEALKEAAR